MYAIVFDLSTEALVKYFSPTSPNNGYAAISKILVPLGFQHKQGSVYFGGKNVDSVSTVLAVEELTEKLAWFPFCVSDIRMLRIVDDDDLMPAVSRAASNAAALVGVGSHPALSQCSGAKKQ
jgi:virulence-associated protein VapD